MAGEKQGPVGYDDTPTLPGQKWRVHDGNRPHPKVVTPGEGTSPPSDATVLFNGSDASGWVSKHGGEIGWTVEHGYMQVAPQTGDIVSKVEFGDCQLHAIGRTSFNCPATTLAAVVEDFTGHQGGQVGDGVAYAALLGERSNDGHVSHHTQLPFQGRH